MILQSITAVLFVQFLVGLVLASASRHRPSLGHRITATTTAAAATAGTTASDNISESQLSALQALYNSTNGAHWSWRNTSFGAIWDFTSTAPSPCGQNWQGVGCTCTSSYCVVDSLNLTLYNLSGTLPFALADLANLTVLVLSRNNLTSTIPDNLGQLSALVTLRLDRNRLTGFVPDMSSLRELTQFNVSFNNLSGSFPLGLTTATNLVSINIESNGFTGFIPAGIGNLTNLTLLDVNNNFFNGTIPAELGNCTHLMTVFTMYNDLSGSIPVSLTGLKALQQLRLSLNFLTGTILSGFGNMSSLSTLSLSGNYLHGAIPDELCASSLTVLDLSGNVLEQSIPACFSQMPLQSLLLDGNSLTGSLPVLSNNSQLRIVTVQENFLIGNVTLCDLPVLEFVDLSLNSFTGPLPSLIVPNLSGVQIYRNYLTGPIPLNLSYSLDLEIVDVGINLLSGSIDAFLLNRPIMTALLLDDNCFTGSLPSVASPSSYLVQFIGSANFLTGTIPSNLANKTGLVEIAMDDNNLTGTLPSSLQQLKKLQSLDLASNALTGPLNGRFNSSLQLFLKIVDLSQNQFSGDLPAEPFLIQSLGSFAATTNCLSAALPEEICQASGLTALALDGLGTAPACRHYLFSEHSYLDAFTLAYFVSGTIPSCIFSMVSIESLHLSGNALEGWFDVNLNISTKLADIVLSYNHLTGDLPYAMHFNHFTMLDLSYNYLQGTFPPDFMPVVENGSLYLQVNRFSGNLPDTIGTLGNISVLDGNMFACGFYRSELPTNDPRVDTYACGSNDLNNSMVIWLTVIGVAVAGVCCGIVFVSPELQSLSTIAQTILMQFQAIDRTLRSANTTSKAIELMMKFFDTIQGIFLGLTMFIVLICMPIYAALSHSQSSYEHVYSWTVSAVLLDGSGAAIVLTVLFTLLVCYAIHLLEANVRPLVAPSDGAAAAHDDVEHHERRYISIGRVVVIDIVNLTVMIVVDIVYVYILLTYDSAIVTITQLSTAAFKILWNESVIWRSVPTMKRLSQHFCQTTITDIHRLSKRELNFIICSVLMNNLVFPAIAIMVVSSNCFYNAIFAANAVDGSYEVDKCSLSTANFHRFVLQNAHSAMCQYGDRTTENTSYDPPFVYSYLCASMISINYTSVYIYMFLLVGIMQPLSKLALKFWYASLVAESKSTKWLDSFLSERLKPISTHKDATCSVIHIEQLVARIVSYLAILLSFGSIFPPLAIIACIALYIGIYTEQILAGSLLMGADTLQIAEYRANLNTKAANIVEFFLSSVWLLMPFVSAMHCYLMFDTFGHHYSISTLLVGAMVVLPSLFWATTTERFRSFTRRQLQKRFRASVGSSTQACPAMVLQAFTGEIKDGDSTVVVVKNPVLQETEEQMQRNAAANGVIEMLEKKVGACVPIVVVKSDRHNAMGEVDGSAV